MMNSKMMLMTLVLVLVAVPASAGWSDLAQLTASDAFDDDRFGWSCAVQGGIAVVGAPWADGANTQEGAAYVYEIDQASGGMTEVATLVWSIPTKSDFLGYSVAIDGDVIVVGAHQDRNGGQGRALVFLKPEGGWSGTIEESAVLRASNRGSKDYFGFSVDIDGETIVVGAWGEDTQGGAAGAVYVYAMPDSGWDGVLVEDAMLVPSSGTNTWMGTQVAVEGGVVVSGGHGASYDGDNYRGQAFVFVEPDSGWSGTLSPTAELRASDGRAGDRFGRGIDISEGHVAVGAHLDEPPGSNTNYGSVYMFKQPNTGWSGVVNEIARLEISDPSSQCKFGYYVKMEGTTVVASSLVKEAVYVFQRPVTGWAPVQTETQKIANATGGDDEFGHGIAVSANHVLVAAPYDDMVTTNAGRAYLFGPPVANAGDPLPVPGRMAVRAAPNPFNPRTVVNFELPKAGTAEVAIYDVAGHRVRVLERRHFAAGSHRATWDGADDAGRGQPSGVYFARVTAAGVAGVTKLMLVR